MSAKKNGRGSRYVGHRARFLIGAAFEMLRSRTAILGVKVSILYLFVLCPKSPAIKGFFRPYCVTRVRFFLMRSAACLRVIRFRQSGQYLTLLEVDAKNVPHTVHFFLSSV